VGTHRIGICTGGGDAPGLNAVIRAVVKHAVGQLHWQVVGIEDGFNGLLDDPPRLVELKPQSCQGLLHRGGTILGTTNRGDPFAWPDGQGGRVDRSEELARAAAAEGLEGIIVVGGDGTQRIGWRLMRERGLQVVGVPKTIDNDLDATDLTFGFMSAVEVATEALDRLHTTAEAHDRVMILELMGRSAGWIALYTGLAGGADCILLPELPYDLDRVCGKIQARKRRGRQFTMIVVAEGATPRGGPGLSEAQVLGQGAITAGSAGHALAQALSQRLDVETRVTVLGHLQRGGSPIASDRILATRFGHAAVELVAAGRWGEMVALRDNQMSHVPLAEVSGAPRTVPLDHPLLATARAVGVEFGG
jgi:ATP-dependent phosphofructokinase / diphosphate-dependent phosphofructokinase